MAKLLIFDLDGTLIDTMGTYADIAARTMERHGGLPFSEGRRRYLETSGNPFFMQIREIFSDGQVDMEEMNNAFETEKAIYFSKKIESEDAISPDTLKALSQLRRKEVKLCISSNNYQALVDALVAKTPNLFEDALGYREDFGKGEPHFDYLRTKYELGREHLCFVGDSLRDAQKAKAYGIQFIGISGTFSEEEFRHSYPEYTIIPSLGTLPAIYEGIS